MDKPYPKIKKNSNNLNKDVLSSFFSTISSSMQLLSAESKFIHPGFFEKKLKHITKPMNSSKIKRSTCREIIFSRDLKDNLTTINSSETYATEGQISESRTNENVAVFSNKIQPISQCKALNRQAI